MSKYNIIFKGKDYSKIDSVDIFVQKIPSKTISSVPDDNSLIKYLKENKKILLEKFLAKIDNNFTLNTSDNRESHHRHKPTFKETYFGGEETYFGGIVGILKKKDLKLSDYIDGTDSKNEAGLIPQDLRCDITLQISSRMDDKSKPYFLATMLLNEKIRFNDDTVPNNEEEIFDYLLLFWFKKYLQEAFLKGYFRTYMRFEKNDDRLKGSIDFSRHIRLNLGQKNGKIAYSYRDNTVNNYMNQLIIAAYEYLNKKYPDIVADNFDNNQDLKSIITNLRTAIGYQNYTSYQLILRNLKPIAHPYYTEYENLRKTCLKILRNEGISLFDGNSDDSVKSILFYLPDLWEDYLQRQMEKFLSDKEILLACQEEIRVFGYESPSEVHYKQKTYPDYVFYDIKDKGKEPVPFFVLDAKFQPIWEKSIYNKKRIPKYHLDDYDKAIRDMVTIDAKATGIIFPAEIYPPDTDLDTLLQHPISKHNSSTLFYTIPIKIVSSDGKTDYLSWKKEFDKELSTGIQYIMIIIEREYDFFIHGDNTHKRKALFSSESASN